MTVQALRAFVVIVLPAKCLCMCATDEPDVLVDGFDGNWYLNRDNVQLSCIADANPAVSLYQWRV